MAISTQIQNLNLIPGKSAPVVVHLSQGNVGDTVQFYLYDGDNPYYPSGVSIAVHGIRSDGTAFGPYTVSSSSSSNLVSFDIVSAMTSVYGASVAELVISDTNENQVGTANFGMLIEKTPYSSSVTYEDDLSIYQRILAYVQSQSADIAQKIDWYYMPEMFGAVGDGETDDSAAIQEMFDAIPNGAHVIFTKQKYFCNSPLTLSKNMIKISGGWERDEYGSCIKASFTGGTLLTVKGPGCQFSNILFEGPANSWNASISVTLVEFDATAAEANIDAIFNNVGFFNAYRCVLAKGRNVRCFNCIFSSSYIGFQPGTLEDYPDQDYRGFVIQGCRIHGIGTMYYNPDLGGNTVKRGHIIKDNYLDFTGTLLNGISDCYYVDGNIMTCYDRSSTMVLITNNTAHSSYDVISNNTFVGRVTDLTVTSTGVEISGANVIIKGNTFIGIPGTCVYLRDGAHSYIEDNVLMSRNGWAIQATTDSRGTIMNNMIMNTSVNRLINATGMTESGTIVDGQAWIKTGTITKSISGGTLNDAVASKTGDTITVSGRITGVSTPASGKFFTVPEGFRPRNTVYVSGFMIINGVSYFVPAAISTNGDVNISWSSSATATVIGFYGSYAV